MAISKLHLNNFRGIGEQTELDIKPITIFVGPNSSGKSSCLHALACLSQTLQIVADERPLILDDESADVHLGRFIEVIHSKSYQDQISLGITVPNAEIIGVKKAVKDEDASDQQQYKHTRTVSDLTADYQFKCTKRTQEVALESFSLLSEDFYVSGKRSLKKYSITLASGKKIQIPKDELLSHGFLLNETNLMIHGVGIGENPMSNYQITSAQKVISSELTKTLYLGPFRQPPARTYDNRGATPSEVGPMGEATITMLANESIQSKSRLHLAQISGWLSHIGLAKGVDVARVGGSGLFTVDITLKDGDKFPLADLGYGVSQALPVLTQCSFAPDGATLLFEQPELHVHPLASKGLAKVFIDTVREKSARVCLETHSPELVRSFCNMVKNGMLKPEELVIYSVSRNSGKTDFKRIDVDDHGDSYDNWSKGLAFEV